MFPFSPAISNGNQEQRRPSGHHVAIKCSTLGRVSYRRQLFFTSVAVAVRLNAQNLNLTPPLPPGQQIETSTTLKQVLELFNHPFILKLYTTFQDANRVYFLTELLTGGELWSVIYESSSGFSSGGPTAKCN